MKIEEIKDVAQWVVSNRYPKSEHEKMDDFELFNGLVDKIKALLENQANRIKELEQKLYGQHKTDYLKND